MARKNDFSDLDDLLQQVNIRTSVTEALQDILKTDFRQDPDRAVKIMLLYQAGLLDEIEARLVEVVEALNRMVPREEKRPGRVIGSIAAMKAKKK